jgi:NADP-dependent 3-hydroxy acid dehydrogenase YdfG
MGSIADKVAIVTGASSGIGAATAHELARRGATVVLAARRIDRLHEHEKAITANGGRATSVQTDVTDSAQVSRLVSETEAAFGRVDVLVNNAGAFWRQNLADTTVEDLYRLVHVNLIGAMLPTQAVLPGMLARRQGAIVTVGSVSGRVAMEPVYSATKYGLRGFSLAVRRQVAGSGVTASCVSPGNIRTEMTQHITGHLPEPHVVATTICDLVVRPRREVVIPHRHYGMVWLEQLSPGLADLAYRWRHWSPVE